MSTPELSILVVHDDDADVQLLRELLRAGGEFPYQLLPAARAEAAVVLVSRPVDVVVVACSVPASELLATVAELRAAASAAAVVVISREPNRRLGLDLLHAGAQDHLYRAQLSPDLVARSVRYAVERGSRERERERAERATQEIRRRDGMVAELCSAVTVDQVAAILLEDAVRASGAGAAWLSLLQPGSSNVRVFSLVPLPQGVRDAWERIAGDGSGGPVEAALRFGDTLVIEPDEWPARFDEYREARTAGGRMLLVPMVGRTRPLAVLALEQEPASPVSPEDVQGIALSARKAALALERAILFEAEHRARDEAEAAIRSRDEVLAIVAHDLRNPLSAVSAYCSLLSDAGCLEENRPRYHGAIHRVVRQMDGLIQDLLDVTRLEAGRLPLDLDVVDARGLAAELAELMEATAAGAGVQLRTHADRDLPPVRVDRARVLQALSNIVANAVRFSPSGGTVSLRVERVGSDVLFVVTDQGPGIPAESVPHLFDRFWQARMHRNGGAGLGLAIAKGIVEAHGGRIGVETAEGAGSSFFLILPAHVEAAPAVEPDPGVATDAPSVEPPTRPVSVLLADDHAVVRRGLVEALRRDAGIGVVTEAASGEEAVERVRLQRPDVVVMDLAMPGIGGLEATRRIRERHPEVRVVAGSAESEEAALLPFLAAGGSGFVRKTDAHEDLAPAVRAAVRDEVFLHPHAARLVLGRYVGDEHTKREVETLTEHEREIVALAAEGFSSAEIGKKLFLAPSTVDSYRSRAMRKLGLGHRADLVRLAVRTGLLASR